MATMMVSDGPWTTQDGEIDDTGDVVLRVTGLTKRYGTRVAVDGLDLEVRRGEVFGLLGPNGAGKTTAVAMILGLIKPQAGRIEILGHDVAHGFDVPLRRVGAMVETPAFYPYLSGLDNLRALALARGGVPAERFAAVLSRVGLSGRERDRVSTYSLGMKQRLGIAGALLHDPDLLILDEPSNGLDPAGMVEIRRLLRYLAGDGKTIVLCSHLLHEVEQVCDRVAVLVHGRVRAEGAVETLLRQGAVTVLRVDDPDAAELILRCTPWVNSVVRDGDVLRLRLVEPYAFALGHLLSEHGFAVAELRRQERDLEEIFLGITTDNAAMA